MDEPVQVVVAGHVIRFPDERSARGFRAVLDQIRDAGDDPDLWWEDVYVRFGGRVVEW